MRRRIILTVLRREFAETIRNRLLLATILIPPQSITKANYKLLFTSGFLKKSDVCNGTFTKYCK